MKTNNVDGQSFKETVNLLNITSSQNCFQVDQSCCKPKGGVSRQVHFLC
jgi:hypothetical protein